MTVSPPVESESKVQVGEVRKFVPLTITEIFDWPCVPELGLRPVIVGAGLPAPAATVNPLVRVELWPSVFVTVTLRVPVVALD